MGHFPKPRTDTPLCLGRASYTISALSARDSNLERVKVKPCAGPSSPLGVPGKIPNHNNYFTIGPPSWQPQIGHVSWVETTGISPVCAPQCHSHGIFQLFVTFSWVFISDSNDLKVSMPQRCLFSGSSAMICLQRIFIITAVPQSIL